MATCKVTRQALESKNYEKLQIQATILECLP
jgi:hypothetical protein